MRMQHVAQQQFRRLANRFVLFRRISTTTTILTLLWVYVLYWGERSVYRSRIEACAWKKWEQWPRDATPHHLIFIADPQLVDPHTYPGRPWPLSALTESYTDLYMTRNFRFINAQLDPDSFIFLGDLFDGGREWPPEKATQLQTNQRKVLGDLGVLPRTKENKRSWDTYKAALGRPHNEPISKAEHNIGLNGEDLKAFIPGEDGRWAKWGSQQWYDDLRRFAKIFYEPTQLYPNSHRTLFAAYDVSADSVSVENGAKKTTWQEYATFGSKSRQLINSLPGNHDIGLGAGVQLVVRDRFESHFGTSNRVDVIGNHTIVSVDTPSLSAHSQYMRDGWESQAEHYENLTHIWAPAMNFLDTLPNTTMNAVNTALEEYYPDARRVRGWNHEVVNPRGAGGSSSWGPSSATPVEKQNLPVILLTHIPLFRNPNTDCGPMRERGDAIKVQMGYQYQNVLTQTLSRDLISKVSLAGDVHLIFSGDDHDYCDIIHRYNIPIPGTNAGFPRLNSPKTQFEHIREITVKSFSWAMGVRKPGFLLVSLWNPVDADGETVGTPLPTIQTHNCLLPDQLSIFIDYGLLFLLTAITLVSLAIYRVAQAPEVATFEDPLSRPLTPLRTLTPTRMSFPRSPSKVNDLANGFPSPGVTSKSRHQRGSSTSTSAQNQTSSDVHLGVQRHYNARTRSVSPSFAGRPSSQYVSSRPNSLHANGPLIDKAGFYPPVKWIDPADEDSDEESHVGENASEVDDSQAKWKWRRRTRSRARKVLDELLLCLLIVGAPGTLWYFYLIGSG